MSIYDAVGRVVRGWIFGLRCLRYGRVREPFFVIAGLQLVLLLLLGFFHREWFAGALTPLVRLLGGGGATHYPEHFWRLPELYRTANAAFMVAFGIFAQAAAILGFCARRERWKPAFHRARALVPVALAGIGVAWAITTAFDQLPREIVLYSSIVRLGFQGIELGLIAGLLTLLAYAPAFVVLDGAPAVAAIRGSVKLALSLPLHTLLAVAVPMVLLFPATFFMYEMNMDEAGVAPEAVGLLLTGLIVVRVLMDVLVLGATTAFFLAARKSER